MDAQAKITIVWVSYAIGILVTGTPFLGVIMAYFCRRTNNEPGLAGHNAAQIRAFWWGFLGWVIAIGIMGIGLARSSSNTSSDPEVFVIGGLLILMGLLMAVVVQIAFTIYAIVGIVRASNRRNWPGAETMQSHTAVFG